jgi:hypothetical protein
MDSPAPYNPLEKRNLAASIATGLLRQDPKPLPPSPFEGAGVYLVYYSGNFDLYRPIAMANREGRCTQPFYVGKAVPAGARKGGSGLETKHGRALSKRLAEHADSIRAASNLRIEDFRCRWLVVDEVFIRLGETLLISHFRPLWNLVVDGFGNHPPGSGRATGKKPMWDVLHPGRAWGAKLGAGISATELAARIQEHYKVVSIPPPRFDL